MEKFEYWSHYFMEWHLKYGKSNDGDGYHRTYCAWSAFTYLGLLPKLYIVHWATSQPTNVSKMCSVGFFVKLQPVGWNVKDGLVDPPFWMLGQMLGSGMGPFNSPLMISYQLSIDTYCLPFTVLKWFSWLQKRFCLPTHSSEPDTLTVTAQEAIVSSSGKT